MHCIPIIKCLPPHLRGPRPQCASAAAGLRGLTRLRIARRPFLTDARLAPVLAGNRGSLLRLELAGCASLTDAALLHLLPLHELAGEAAAAREGAPREEQQSTELDVVAAAAADQQSQSDQQAVAGKTTAAGPHGAPQQGVLPPRAQQGPSQRDETHLPPVRYQSAAQPLPAPAPLEHLQLVCCDRVTGGSLRRLGRLRSLRLGGCPVVAEEAVQVGGPRFTGAHGGTRRCPGFSRLLQSSRAAQQLRLPSPVGRALPNPTTAGLAPPRPQAAVLSLTRLTLLELPGHIPASSMPVAPAGTARHLSGLTLQGGRLDRWVNRRG